MFYNTFKLYRAKSYIWISIKLKIQKKLKIGCQVQLCKLKKNILLLFFKFNFKNTLINDYLSILINLEQTYV